LSQKRVAIDRFGLRKKQLFKYNNDIEKLFDRIAKYKFKTEIITSATRI